LLQAPLSPWHKLQAAVLEAVLLNQARLLLQLAALQAVVLPVAVHLKLVVLPLAVHQQVALLRLVVLVALLKLAALPSNVNAKALA